MSEAARIISRFLGFTVTLAVILAVSTPQLAEAQSFHKYAIAKDGSQFAYTGVYSSRIDQAPTGGQNPGPCSAVPYQGTPLYYTQWVIIRDGPNSVLDFTELGLAHACVGQKYWYWGYGWNGTWYPLGEDWAPPLGQTNYYDLHRVAQVWYWNINGLNRATMTWNAVGIRVEGGLESYNANATTNYINHSQLQKTLSESPWYNFANATSSVNSGLCGVWVTQYTVFKTRQGTPC